MNNERSVRRNSWRRGDEDNGRCGKWKGWLSDN